MVTSGVIFRWIAENTCNADDDMGGTLSQIDTNPNWGRRQISWMWKRIVCDTLFDDENDDDTATIVTVLKLRTTQSHYWVALLMKKRNMLQALTRGKGLSCEFRNRFGFFSCWVLLWKRLAGRRAVDSNALALCRISFGTHRYNRIILNKYTL